MFAKINISNILSIDCAKELFIGSCFVFFFSSVTDVVVRDFETNLLAIIVFTFVSKNKDINKIHTVHATTDGGECI